MNDEELTARLDDIDRRMIAKAREVAALKTADVMRERYGDTDSEMARAAALGEAQFLLLELADLAGRLAARPAGYLDDAAAEVRAMLDVNTARYKAGAGEPALRAIRAERLLIIDRLVAIGAAGHLALPQAAPPVADFYAACAGCGHCTASVPCPRCGGPACSVCGRCPPCDGPVPDEEE